MEIIELLKAAIVGIVEGLTEWLPISSTGHMILVDEFLPLKVSPKFLTMFLVVIQLGAILAVILLYFKRLNPFAPSKSPAERRRTWSIWGKVVIGCIPAAVIGFLLDDWADEHFYNAVTVSVMLIAYGIAYIVVERVKSKGEKGEPGLAAIIGKHSPGAVAAAVGAEPGAAVASGVAEAGAGAGRPSVAAGVAESAAEARRSGVAESAAGAGRPSVAAGVAESAAEARRSSVVEGAAGAGRAGGAKPGRSGGEITSVTDLSISRVLGIGLFQCLAIIPGTSRSGSTILGGRILGVSREAAAEFSFFLAIPVMFGWSLLKIVKGFVLDDIALTTTEWGVFAVGIVVAFLVSIAAIKFLMGYIKNHSFEVFGWYRIVLGIVVLAFFYLTGQLL